MGSEMCIRDRNKPLLASLFSLIVCLVYGFMFNAMQANTIVAGFSNSFNIRPSIIGIIIVILSALVIFGGLKRISDITSLIVPIMALAYLGLVLFILITNLDKVGPMFALIFREAFSMKAGFGGLFGTAILNGVKRGLFSNEAGMGAVPNACLLYTSDAADE